MHRTLALHPGAGVIGACSHAGLGIPSRRSRQLICSTGVDHQRSDAALTMIGPLPKLTMRMSGEGSHERIPDLTSIGGKPWHLGQHENVVPARATSLGDHLKSATPHVKRNDAGLVGRDPDDAD